jgi:hypothetical protein
MANDLNRHIKQNVSGEIFRRISAGSTQDDSRVRVQVWQLFRGPQQRIIKGGCFAKAYISTAAPPPRQDARVSFAHEDGRWPQSACGAPQEGTSSPHTGIATGPRSL